MWASLTNVQALAIVLTVLVATAGAVRAVIFGIQTGRPFLMLGAWLSAMAGSVAVVAAVPALLAGGRPLWSAEVFKAFVLQHDMSLDAVLVIGTLASAALEILRPARRSAVAAARAEAIGAAGEGLVALALHQAGYPTLHGVMLGGRGCSTEIDHVVRTPGSIVVIETKTLAGRIDGRPGDRQWVQRSAGRERWFLNPLRQNAAHLEVLRRTIGAIDAPLRGVVVVAGTATIADELRGYVVPVSELVTVLDGERPSGGRSLDQAWSILQQVSARGGDRRAHAAYVRRRWHRA